MTQISHRICQEHQQIQYFSLPAATPQHRHRHVLPHGTNWTNLFTSIAGADGTADRFFEERRIKWWSSPVTGDPRWLRGPTHNALSSQVACVNVLLPLREDPDALTAMLQALDPEVETVVAVNDGHTERPASVEFEWVGAKGHRSLEGTAPTRGQRVTSTDAVLVARLKNGALRGYLMEWKYVETGDEADKRAGTEGETRRGRYRQLFETVFKTDATLDNFLVDPAYQLMRLSLLARQVLDKQQLPGVTSMRTVLVCPRENFAYRKLRADGLLRARFQVDTLVEVMRAGLREPQTFIDTSPAELVQAVRRARTPGTDRVTWLAYMAHRYGW